MSKFLFNTIHKFLDFLRAFLFFCIEFKIPALHTTKLVANRYIIGEHNILDVKIVVFALICCFFDIYK